MASASPKHRGVNGRPFVQKQNVKSFVIKYLHTETDEFKFRMAAKMFLIMLSDSLRLYDG